MRPTSSTMLQQNNNNNYPCLSQTEILQKCSRTSLLFPSRLELGDLPLVRGLRAWALCSKNRRKAGGPLWGGKAPAAAPPGRRSSTACPRPADVHLSGELGRPGYGLPPGLDARALVTVATLKPSEGSGKTQTRCLFLRTEKGSCLYSTAKPSPGGTTSAAPGMVGEWLKGKPGRAESPPGQDVANRVRVRSDRRWRKSGNVAAGQERKERQQMTEPTVEERQEEPDKGGPESPQQNVSRTRGCRSASPERRSPCGRRAQRRRSRDEQEDSGSLDKTNEVQRGERQEAEPNPDPEPDRASSSCDADEGGETTEAERAEESRTQTTRVLDDFTEAEDANPDVVRGRAGDTMETRWDRKPEDFCQQPEASDDEGPESEKLTESFSSADPLRPAEPFTPQEGKVSSSGPELDFSFVPEQNFAAEESNTATEDSKKKKVLVPLKDSQLAEKEPVSSASESERQTVEGEDGSTGTGPDGSGAEASEDKEDCGPEPEESWKDEDQDEDQDTSGQTTSTRVEHNTCVFNPVALFSPAPSLPPRASMATDPPSLEAEEEEEREANRGAEEERRRRGDELEDRGSTVDPEEVTKEEEEDEFGVFVQAEGEPAWSEGVNVSSSVPCGSRGRIAPGAPAGSTRCSSDWTGLFHQSDDTWTAFPQDSTGPGQDVVEQWWPTSAVEAKTEQLPTNNSLASVFAEAFPSPPGTSSCELHAVPTLTQLLGGRAGQDQRLLDRFHDLNKMIGRSCRRASRASRDLRLRTLHLQPPAAESRAAAWMANGHLSPGLPSVNQHAHHAAAKRRLSYDYNRNTAE